MSLASLKEELNTGIESLDYEHRKLIGIIEELCDRYDAAPTDAEISDCFGRLYAEISAHFALEERLMRENSYPQFTAHKADHERLLEQIRNMMDAFENGMCADCGMTLRGCMEAWLSSHVANADSDLRGLTK